MNDLRQNAIQSIQLGVEDFQSNDPRRPLSAARNFFSGVLLLAKQAIIEAAPNADPQILIAAKLKIAPDENGGIKLVTSGAQTIDFNTVGERLKDFGIKVDQGALQTLNRIRNEIEHRYTSHTGIAIREAIAKAFPVVADLCRFLGLTPSAALGGTWSVMIGVKEVHDVEFAKCKETFSAIRWKTELLANASWECPECGSALLMQDDPEIRYHGSMNVTCQSCDNQISAEALVEHFLEDNFAVEAFQAVRHDGPVPVHTCPWCSVDAYVTWGSQNGCVWCDHKMDRCELCDCSLTPENVAWDHSSRCCYCDHILSKDD